MQVDYIMVIHQLLGIHPKKPQKYQLQQQDFGVRNQWLYLDMSGHVRLRFWECTSLIHSGEGIAQWELSDSNIDHDISIKIPLVLGKSHSISILYLSILYICIHTHFRMVKPCKAPLLLVKLLDRRIATACSEWKRPSLWSSTCCQNQARRAAGSLHWCSWVIYIYMMWETQGHKPTKLGEGL